MFFFLFLSLWVRLWSLVCLCGFCYFWSVRWFCCLRKFSWGPRAPPQQLELVGAELAGCRAPAERAIFHIAGGRASEPTKRKEWRNRPSAGELCVAEKSKWSVGIVDTPLRAPRFVAQIGQIQERSADGQRPPDHAPTTARMRASADARRRARAVLAESVSSVCAHSLYATSLCASQRDPVYEPRAMWSLDEAML